MKTDKKNKTDVKWTKRTAESKVKFNVMHLSCNLEKMKKGTKKDKAEVGFYSTFCSTWPRPRVRNFKGPILNSKMGLFPINKTLVIIT